MHSPTQVEYVILMTGDAMKTFLGHIIQLYNYTTYVCHFKDETLVFVVFCKIMFSFVLCNSSFHMLEVTSSKRLPQSALVTQYISHVLMSSTPLTTFSPLL